MKVSEAKRKALELFRKDDYQTLFERLFDETSGHEYSWDTRSDDPHWPVSLKLQGDEVWETIQLNDFEIQISMVPFSIGGHFASFGCGYGNDVCIARAMMNNETVIIYEFDHLDPFNPLNIYRNSELLDIHEYHHNPSFYEMLDAYRQLLKLRAQRKDDAMEAELAKRYAGKFTF